MYIHVYTFDTFHDSLSWTPPLQPYSPDNPFRRGIRLSILSIQWRMASLVQAWTAQVVRPGWAVPVATRIQLAYRCAGQGLYGPCHASAAQGALAGTLSGSEEKWMVFVGSVPQHTLDNVFWFSPFRAKSRRRSLGSRTMLVTRIGKGIASRLWTNTSFLKHESSFIWELDTSRYLDLSEDSSRYSNSKIIFRCLLEMFK